MAGSTFQRLLAGGPRLTVGLITADLLHLSDELMVLETAGVELVHVDVMDGVFCPMLTVGPPVISAIRTGLLKDVHLMIDDPLATLDQYVAAGADMVTFHVEGARQPHRVLQVLATAVNANDPDRGIIRGVAVNPSSPLEVVRPLLGDMEYLLILAVNPGWGGQGFITSTEGRLVEARRMIDDIGREILLGVDGGVTRANVDHVGDLGVDIIVSGSAVFDGRAAAANAAFMLDGVRQAAARHAVAARGGG
jgi:ribulose-phosphate 3-epimerase